MSLPSSVLSNNRSQVNLVVRYCIYQLATFAKTLMKLHKEVYIDQLEQSDVAQVQQHVVSRLNKTASSSSKKKRQLPQK